MNVVVNEENGKTYVLLEGRLDTANSHMFESRVIPLAEKGEPDITLDCTDFRYISSSGLRQFLMLLKTVNANQGKLLIRHLKPEIKEVFDLTGFTPLFVIE